MFVNAKVVNSEPRLPTQRALAEGAGLPICGLVPPQATDQETHRRPRRARKTNNTLTNRTHASPVNSVSANSLDAYQLKRKGSEEIESSNPRNSTKSSKLEQPLSRASVAMTDAGEKSASAAQRVARPPPVEWSHEELLETSSKRERDLTSGTEGECARQRCWSVGAPPGRGVLQTVRVRDCDIQPSTIAEP